MERIRDAVEILEARKVNFEFDGDMQAGVALNYDLMQKVYPFCRLSGPANVLVFANTDAASGVRNILKMKAGGLEVGPVLMGMGNRAHIVTPEVTQRGLINIATLTSADVASYG